MKKRTFCLVLSAALSSAALTSGILSSPDTHGTGPANPQAAFKAEPSSDSGGKLQDLTQPVQNPLEMPVTADQEHPIRLLPIRLPEKAPEFHFVLPQTKPLNGI